MAQDLYLENAITGSVHTAKSQALEEELIKVRTEKEVHYSADSNFKTTVITAFQLANKASGLFKSSKTSEKRELINFLFSNLCLRGRQL